MGRRVLVVEDNNLNRKLFCDLLEAIGCQTIETSRGDEALSLVRIHRPDLILMDIQLPFVSGIDLARSIKGDPEVCSIPIVAITAFALKYDAEIICANGCDAYLSKPISVGRFMEVVQCYVQ